MSEGDMKHRSGATARYTRTVESAERDAKACRLKAQGWTYERISDELGYGSKANAYRAVQQALADVPAQAAEELRGVMVLQLEYLYSRVMEALERQHLSISQGGKGVVHNGKELLDD